MIGTLKR